MCAARQQANPRSKRTAPQAAGPEGSVLGVRVSALGLPATVQRIRDAVARQERGYICVRDVHGVIECQHHADLMQIHNEAFLTVPDGMPLVWALKRAGLADAGRVYGPDLMLSVIGASVQDGTAHYLYGSTPKVLDKLETALRSRFPGVKICGRMSPPFRPLSSAEQDDIAATINASGADIVWVGLGTPKQERWMAGMRDRLDAAMLVGVGAAFDFHAGTKPQAPGWMRRNGLEWVFRLASEPRRLWRRYARVVPQYLYLSTLQRLGLRNFATPSPRRETGFQPRVIE